MLRHGDKYKERNVETHLLNLALTFAVVMLLPAELSFAMPPELPASLHAIGAVSSCASSGEETAAAAAKKERRGEERRYNVGPQIYPEEKRARANLCKKLTPGAHPKPRGEKEFFLADRLVKRKNHHKLGI